MVSFNPTSMSSFPGFVPPMPTGAQPPLGTTGLPTGNNAPANSLLLATGGNMDAANSDQALNQLMSMVVTLVQNLLTQLNGGSTTPASLPGGTINPSTKIAADGVTQNDDGSHTVMRDGIAIDVPAGVDPNGDWVKKMGTVLDNIKESPEGKVLYTNFQNTHQHIQYNSKSLGGANATGQVINADKFLFDQGLDYATEMMAHEMTHATSNGGDRADTKNEESLASTIGRTIRFEKYGAFTYQGAKGQDINFDGSTKAQEQSYREGVLGARTSDTYRDLPEGTDIFNALEALGLTFKFDLRTVP